jgi:DNA-binding XRE family transcriptional regulator
MLLDDYLKKNRITQTKFASMVGVSRVQVNRLVRKKRTPSLKLAKKIERITQGKVTTDDYFINE